MMKPLLFWTALALTAPLAASAQTAPAPPTGEYMKQAGQSDQFEIQSGRLAVQQASRPAIRRFGEEMVKDHEKSTKLVLAAAKKSGMAPAAGPPPLNADQQTMLAALKGKMGKSFDDTYLHQQMQAHEIALSLQQSYATNGSDPHFEAAAKKIVPVVKKHIAMLSKMEGSNGKAM